MALRTTAFLDSASYGFEWLRLLPELALQEGVYGVNDFKVTAAAAGGMRVDVAAGTALVKGDSGTPGTGLTQGLYPQVNDASIPNAVTLTPASGVNPRIDQIVLQVNDSTDLGTAGNVPALTVVTGVVSAGATLDNRNGAAALPNNCMRLGDVLVPTSSSSVTDPNIRDRRPKARGSSYVFERTAGNINSAAGALADIDSTNFKRRLECSGVPILVVFEGAIIPSGGPIAVTIRLDIDGGASTKDRNRHGESGKYMASTYTWHLPFLTAGSHLFTMRWQNGSGVGMNMDSTAAAPSYLSLTELVRPITDGV